MWSDLFARTRRLKRSGEGGFYGALRLRTLRVRSPDAAQQREGHCSASGTRVAAALEYWAVRSSRATTFMSLLTSRNDIWYTSGITSIPRKPHAHAPSPQRLPLATDSLVAGRVGGALRDEALSARRQDTARAAGIERGASARQV